MRKIAHTAGSDDAFIKAGDLVRVRNRLFRQLCCGNGGEENFGYVSPRGLAPFVLSIRTSPRISSLLLVSDPFPGSRVLASGQPSNHSHFIDACCKPGAGDGERKKDLYLPRTGFLGGGQTCRPTIAFQSDTYYGGGLHSAWAQGGVVLNPASGKEGTVKAWRGRGRLA